MKHFTILYNSALWAMLAALFSFQNEWLEMRVNMGWVFAALWMLLFISFSMILRKRPTPFPLIITAATLVITLSAAWVSLGTKRLAVLPAALIREALRMPRVRFSAINLYMILFLLAGAVVIAAGSHMQRRKSQ